MSRRPGRALLVLVTACAVCSGALAPGASAGATVSRAANFSADGNQIVCGLTMAYGTAIDPGTLAPENGRWPGLQCGAEGIPRPAGPVGDPFVKLGQGRAGRARVINESQDELTSQANPVALTGGRRWSRADITCTIAPHAVECRNDSGHGFRLAPGHLRTF